jgi:hypothetical protein
VRDLGAINAWCRCSPFFDRARGERSAEPELVSFRAAKAKDLISLLVARDSEVRRALLAGPLPVAAFELRAVPGRAPVAVGKFLLQVVPGCPVARSAVCHELRGLLQAPTLARLVAALREHASLD